MSESPRNNNKRSARPRDRSASPKRVKSASPKRDNSRSRSRSPKRSATKMERKVNNQIYYEGKPNISRQAANVFFTHDNGGRPFKVSIEGEHVNVYKLEWDENKREHLYSSEPVHTFTFKKIFIGVSPKNEMTKYLGTYGTDFDGNSILIHEGDLDYVHIGIRIFRIKAKSPIEIYVSRVGNNDVPYPYAIDKEGRHYLMTESVILQRVPYRTDPYHYFYGNRTVVASPSCCCHVEENKEFDGIKKVWKGKDASKRCYLWYQPERDDLGYDWTRGAYRPGEGSKLYGQKNSKTPKFEITREMYISLMEQFAKQSGFSRLLEIEIEPRTC